MIYALRVLVLALFTAPAQLAIAQSTIRIRIANEHRAQLNLGFVSGARAGTDIVEGTLTLQTDGTWTGVVNATVTFDREMKGLGQNCPKANFRISQDLAVTAATVRGFNSAGQVAYSSGSANAGFLALEVKPNAPPSRPPEPCLEDMTGEPFPLLPLNDGRWTNPPPHGYVIGLPRSGVLEYEVVETSCGSSASPPAQKPPVCSEWKIRVERR